MFQMLMFHAKHTINPFSVTKLNPFIAVQKHSASTIKKMTEAGVNFNIINKKGETPAHYALYADTIKVLHKSGVHFNVPDRNGVTPAHRVARLGTSDAIKEMGKTNANFSAADKNGNTPAHYFLDSGCPNPKRIKAMAEVGADFNVKNKNGISPMMKADMEGFLDSKTSAAMKDAGGDVVKSWNDLDALRNTNNNPGFTAPKTKAQHTSKIETEGGKTPDGRKRFAPGERPLVSFQERSRSVMERVIEEWNSPEQEANRRKLRESAKNLSKRVVETSDKMTR